MLPALILALVLCNGCEEAGGEVDEIATYTVTFETNGGSSVASQSILSGSTAIEPKTPTLTGYDFVYWCSDEEQTQSYDFTTPITSDINLYAKWIESIPNTVTVTFESNGGSDVTSQIVNYATTALEPIAPMLTGYTFAGWYSDTELSQAYNFATVVTVNITLYAKWIINQYTLTFVSNGGSLIDAQTVDYNTTASEPDAPTRTNYTFGGWYTEPTFLTEWNFSTYITADTSIYAKWILIEGELPGMGSDNLL